MAQRNQRRRNLDRYDIAGPGLVLSGMLNGDDQVRGIVSKCVGVDVVLGLCRLVKRRAVVYKAVDLHKVAQLIGERNVAGLMLAIAVMDFCRVTNLDNASRDLFEDLLELRGAGCRLVVIGVFRTCAIVDDPRFAAALINNARRGARIVARHGMHELVLVACVLSRGDGTGVCAAKDTDCINVGAVTLDLLGAVDGAICYLVLKVAETRR